METIGLKIDVNGVDEAVKALQRLEYAAREAQKAISEVGFTPTMHSGEAVIPNPCKSLRDFIRGS